MHTCGIKPETIEAAIVETRRHLRANEIYEKTTAIDNKSSSEMVSEECRASCTALEKLLTTYIAVRDTLGDNGFKAKSFEDMREKNVVLNLFSLYAGVVEASDHIDDLFQIETKTRSYGDSFKFDSISGKRDEIKILVADNLLEIYEKAVNSKKSGKELLRSTRDYLATLKDVVEKRAKELEGSSFIQQLKKINLQVNGRVFNGFNSYKGDVDISFDLGYESSVEDREAEIITGYEMSIGNDREAEVVKGLVNLVCLYDGKKNIAFDGKTKPVSILLEGRPGTGKTDFINSTARYMRELCRQKGIRFNPIIVNNSFRSKWYGESIGNLLKKFEEVTKPDSIGLLVLDDVDTIIKSRDVDDPNHTENEILGEFLNWLEGVGKRYRGNYMIMMASNFSEKIDQAVKSRAGRILNLKGPLTAQQYEKVFEIELFDLKSYIKLSRAEWEDIGKLCEDYRSHDATIDGNGYDIKNLLETFVLKDSDLKFSGRDINKICASVKAYVMQPEKITTKMLTAEPEEKQRLFKKLYRRVDFETVKGFVLDRHVSNIRRKTETFEEDVHKRLRMLSVGTTAEKIFEQSAFSEEVRRKLFDMMTTHEAKESFKEYLAKQSVEE